MSRERDRNSSRSSRNHDYLIKLCGIPSSTNKDDIKKSLYPCRIVTIHFFSSNDNAVSDCLVDLESENDVKDALKKTNLSIANRYVEISRATIYEYNFFVKHKGAVTWSEPVLRMHGLPLTCTMADVQIFFKDIQIARNGIYITRDMSDTAVGGGYVAFISMDNAYKAIDIYDRKHIQHRYIELSASSYDEAKKTIMNDAILNGKRFAGEYDDKSKTKASNGRKNRSRSERQSRSTSRDRRYRPVKRRRSSSNSSRSRSRPQSKFAAQHSRDNNRQRNRSRSPLRRAPPTINQNGEYLITMRGMPFTVVEDDIRGFFPSTCQPVRMEILQNRRTSRPNGDGYVYFKSMEEIDEAMKRDRKYMGNRYVELYFDAPGLSSSTTRRSKSNASPSRSPRSPAKTTNANNHHHHHHKSRSRSESEN